MAVKTKGKGRKGRDTKFREMGEPLVDTTGRLFRERQRSRIMGGIKFYIQNGGNTDRVKHYVTNYPDTVAEILVGEELDDWMIRAARGEYIDKKKAMGRRNMIVKMLVDEGERVGGSTANLALKVLSVHDPYYPKREVYWTKWAILMKKAGKGEEAKEVMLQEMKTAKERRNALAFLRVALPFIYHISPDYPLKIEWVEEEIEALKGTQREIARELMSKIKGKLPLRGAIP